MGDEPAPEPEPNADEQSAFYAAFNTDLANAGLEIRDHWHPEDDTAVTYKLRDPRTGKTMRYTIKYTSVVDAEAGSRFATEAIVRFFHRDPRDRVSS